MIRFVSDFLIRPCVFSVSTNIALKNIARFIDNAISAIVRDVTKLKTICFFFFFFFRNLTRGGTIMISRDFTLQKKKLYRSFQQSH